MVKPRAPQGKVTDTKAMEFLQYRGIGAIIDKDTDGIGPLGDGRRIGIQPKLMEATRQPGDFCRGGKVVAVVGLGVEDGDGRHGAGRGD